MASRRNFCYKIIHIPIHILKDISWRFFMILPPRETNNWIRLCFHTELAYWYYLDHYCKYVSNRLFPCGIRTFAIQIFKHVPRLRLHVKSIDTILHNWYKHKQTVPRYGAIILSTDLSHVLLVQPYCAKVCWGFPKGRVNEYEASWKCAAREVLEETGLDIMKFINKNDYIDTVIRKQYIRLYIIPNIPLKTKFEPRTRNEIRACKWFPLAYLPFNRKDMTPKVKMGVDPNAFLSVMPFLSRMRCWAAYQKELVYDFVNSNSSKKTRKQVYRRT